jgi:hypothetical protein
MHACNRKVLWNKLLCRHELARITLPLDSESIKLKFVSIPERFEGRYNRMKGSHTQASLKKFKKTIRRLDLAKRVAASQWLQGVIVAQSLTPDERDELVQASNEYIASFEEEAEYIAAVNTLINFLTSEQRTAKRNLKKRGKRGGKQQRKPD